MFSKVMALPLWLHGALAVAAFAAFQGIKTRLDASYAASAHPVDYATGQLAFDADTLEGYYAVMQNTAGLEVYWTTQFIDFSFLASVMAMGLLIATLVARVGRVGSWGRLLALIAAGLAMAGAGMDAVENLLSFVMLRQPQDISQAVAITYSSAAATKFALLASAMLLLPLALLLALWSRRQA